MKLRYLIIFAFIQTTALAGCEWKNTNGLYKDYIHEDEGDGNGGHIVPCPGFFHPAVEGVTPAYYELSSGRCYKTEDLEKIPVADKDAKLISFDNIKTLQSLQDYKICEIFRSEPGYYFDQEESPAKLTYIGEYSDIESFFDEHTEYDYHSDLEKYNENWLSHSKYEISKNGQLCPTDFPYCTAYFLKAQNTKKYFEIFSINTYEHQDYSKKLQDEIEDYFREQPFAKDHFFYDFICTKQHKDFTTVNDCSTNELSCDGFCINPKTNPYHCGAKGDCDNDAPNSQNFKGVKCDPLEVCDDGKCTPDTGLILCKEGNSQFVEGNAQIKRYIDPRTDNFHCGARGQCNNNDEESSDFMGKVCNTPAEQCIEGNCIFVSCDEETNKKLCTINGQSDCTDITSVEHCGSCFQGCYHPQSDAIDVSCKEIKVGTTGNEKTTFECVSECKEGYTKDDYITPTTDETGRNILVCISKDFICDDDHPCADGWTCDKAHHCISPSIDNNCPDDAGNPVVQDFHHCGSDCLNCQIYHGVSGTCINGDCAIDECETGFHLSADKKKCILNTSSHCAPVDSTETADCTSSDSNTDADNNLKTFECIDGECQVTGCKDTANLFVEDGFIQCEPNNETYSCGPLQMDCNTIDINLKKTSNTFKCSPYEALIQFDNTLNGNMCHLIDNYCEDKKDNKDRKTYHSSANNQTCRLDTHYECGPRHEECKDNEICGWDSKLNIYHCIQKGASTLNQCKEGELCENGFKFDYQCHNNICQDPRINDLNCYEEDGFGINCVALRNKLYDQNSTNGNKDVPTGVCKYDTELYTNLAYAYNPNPVIQKGNWYCECPGDTVFCHTDPFKRQYGAYDLYKDDIDEDNHSIDIYESDYKCLPRDMCNYYIFESLKGANEGEDEGEGEPVG